MVRGWGWKRDRRVGLGGGGGVRVRVERESQFVIRKVGRGGSWEYLKTLGHGSVGFNQEFVLLRVKDIQKWIN